MRSLMNAIPRAGITTQILQFPQQCAIVGSSATGHNTHTIEVVVENPLCKARIQSPCGYIMRNKTEKDLFNVCSKISIRERINNA